MSRSDRGVSTPENEKRLTQEQALLSITVCDVACGSGHILLSAARRIALELARVRTNEDQPTPPSIRQATRDVIRHCIYGVDLNPLAVELCKVALWLEAHNPGEPLNFLDHRIKCGNSIVGLAHKEELKNGIADEAFKTLPEDEKEIATTYRNKNKAERKLADQTTLNFGGVVEEPLSGILQKWEVVNNLPETTPEEIDIKQAKYNQLISGPKWWKLKTLADMQVAQFFIAKTIVNNDRLITDASYREYLNGQKTMTDQPSAMATGIAQQKRFFHWFLEFPEIFVKGGFDCILGNPPYLGGSFLSGKYGHTFLNWIKQYYNPAGGQADLVTYFLRRIVKIGINNGFSAIITTNSISEGDTREKGLDIINKTATIIFALKSTKWPGVANVFVSLLSIFNSKEWNGKTYLNNNQVENINPYLDENEIVNPKILNYNLNTIYKGNDFLGNGFFIEDELAEKWINRNEGYKEFIRKVINGKDLNSGWCEKSLKSCIDFKNNSYEEIRDFNDALLHLENTVVIERKNSNDIGAKEKWWQHLRPRMELNSKLHGIESCIVISQTTKYLSFSIVSSKYLFTKAVCVIPSNSISLFGVLESSIHELWAHQFGSALANTLRYTNSDCFETFPFPKKFNDVDIIGKYWNIKSKYIEESGLGVTNFCNDFHNKNLEGILNQVRKLKISLDNFILNVYGWHEDSAKWGKAIQLKHDFYEVDYLPENDRVRFTIHPEARKEVLKRLLLLNHERYEEEIKQGLHKREDVEKFYEQKGQPVPGGVVFSDVKGSSKPTYKKAAPLEITPPAPQLFESHKEYTPKQEEPLKIASEPKPEQLTTGMKIEWKHSTKEFKFIIRNSAGQEFKYHVSPAAQRGKFTKTYKQILPNSPMANNVIGKNEGDTFEFGGMVYRILRIEV